MSWRDCLTPWPGQPEQCRCKNAAAATLEETLDCPLAWDWTGAGWVHTRRGTR